MTNSKIFSGIYPTTLLFSEFNTVSLALVNELRKTGCNLVVVSEDGSWGKLLNLDKKILILDFFKLQRIWENVFADYIICFPLTKGFYGKRGKIQNYLTKEISFVVKIASETSAKTLFVFPYLQGDEVSKKSTSVINQIISGDALLAGALFLGDVVSPDVNGHFGVLNFLLSKLQDNSGPTIVAENFIFNPLSPQLAAHNILRNLFSLKAYGKKTAILGRPLKIEVLERILKRQSPWINFVYSKNLKLLIQAQVDQKIYVEENLRELILDAYLALETKRKASVSLLTGILKQKEIFSTRPELQKGKYLKTPPFLKVSLNRWALKIFTLFLFSLVFPLIIILLSTVCLLIAKRAYLKNFLGSSMVFLKTTQFLSKRANSYSLFLSRAPLLEKPYKEFSDTSLLLEREANIGIKILNITTSLLEVSDNVFGGHDYDYSLSGKDISLEFELLSQDLGFLQGEIKETGAFSKKVATKVFSGADLSSLRDRAYFLSRVARQLPVLLGTQTPVNYLVLFQDTAVVRPTGGEIKAFALVTFSGGKILKVEAHPSYYIDQRLQGTVEPPRPLKDYFGQEKWFLKDANWDSDFAVSAKQIEWFLDKEMNLPVDGVVALDTEFLRELLKEFGGISVEGLDVKVTNQDFYDLISDIDEKYPSPEGTSPLSIIANALLEKLLAQPKEKRFNIAKTILVALEERRVQVFVHDRASQRAFSDLSWDGSVNIKECQDPCYKDIIALVEAAKSGGSRDITRKVNFSIAIEEGLIKRKLAIFLDNPTEVSYSAYLRVITPADSGFSPVSVVTPIDSIEISPEVFGVRGFKEAGLFVEVSAKETKAVNFSWESGLQLEKKHLNKYVLLIRKQAGISSLQLDVKIKVPENSEVMSFLPSTLTQSGEFVYNTLLSKDTSLSFSWTRK